MTVSPWATSFKRQKASTGGPPGTELGTATAIVFGDRCVMTATHTVTAANVQNARYWHGSHSVLGANGRFEHDPNAAGALLAAGVSIVHTFGTTTNASPTASQPDIVVVQVRNAANNQEFAWPAAGRLTLATAHPLPNRVNAQGQVTVDGTNVSAAGYGLRNPSAPEANRQAARASVDSFRVVSGYFRTPGVLSSMAAFNIQDRNFTNQAVTRYALSFGDSGGPIIHSGTGQVVGISSRASSLATDGIAIIGSVPYALQTLTAAQRTAIETACGNTSLLPANTGFEEEDEYCVVEDDEQCAAADDASYFTYMDDMGEDEIDPQSSPTPFPTASSTPFPTIWPDSSPTAFPTISPDPFPTVTTTIEPESSPTAYASFWPDSTPTPLPTIWPDSPPAANAIAGPDSSPTAFPTISPEPSPTALPSIWPDPSPTPEISPQATPTASPGICGSGVPDEDSDGDNFPDCIDECPDDAAKQLPGSCDCGTPDIDEDLNKIPDCVQAAAYCDGGFSGSGE